MLNISCTDNSCKWREKGMIKNLTPDDQLTSVSIKEEKPCYQKGIVASSPLSEEVKRK